MLKSLCRPPLGIITTVPSNNWFVLLHNLTFCHSAPPRQQPLSVALNKPVEFSSPFFGQRHLSNSTMLGYAAILPVVSALVWLGMLLGMLLWWAVDQHSRPLPSMLDDDDDRSQTIAYISDVGAFQLKPLFISMSAVMVVTLNASFLAERYLRHNGRLAANTSTTQKVLSILSIVFAMIGGAGIILLSIFDTYRHNTLHNIFLLFFIAGYVISAIFVCAEYQRLGIHYRQHRILRISFWVKLFFILVEVVLAIAFVSCSWTGHYNPAAIFEWIVAFIFTLYVLSFALDLLPAVQTARHVPQGLKDTEKNLENAGNRQAGAQGEGHLNDYGMPSEPQPAETRPANQGQSLISRLVSW
jgi:hypothetical protein